MTLNPGVRKFLLTAHITFTVGWLGAVSVFLALSIIGLTSDDAETVRGTYLVMDRAAWFVLIPLAFASLLTGVVQSLGTSWGLFRYYWVIFKIGITSLSTVILVIYMETFSVLARKAGDPSADLDAVRNSSPTLHAAVALVLLLAATALSVYKPRGTTPFAHKEE